MCALASATVPDATDRAGFDSQDFRVRHIGFESCRGLASLCSIFHDHPKVRSKPTGALCGDKFNVLQLRLQLNF